MTRINPALLNQALNRVVKRAFVPSDAAAAAPPGGGGAPPMDPAMMAGMPPGPPMDPSMMGGGPPPPPPPSPSPPPDGSMGGGAEIDAKVQRAVQTAVQAAIQNGPGQGQGGAGKPGKPDPQAMATDIFQLKKMFLAYLRHRGLELPPDILDGPNRDPMTGAPAPSPTGGSDVPGATPSPGPGGAISPIAPMPPASMGGKAAAAEDRGLLLIKAAADVLRLYAILREHNAVAEDIRNGGLDKLAAEMAAEEAAEYAVSPGMPIARSEPDPLQKMAQNAAAVARRFKVRRGHTA